MFVTPLFAKTLSQSKARDKGQNGVFVLRGSLEVGRLEVLRQHAVTCQNTGALTAFFCGVADCSKCVVWLQLKDTVDEVRDAAERCWIFGSATYITTRVCNQ